MPLVTLRPVTTDNWLDALALTVHPEQEHFVPSVAVSLAKAYIKPDGENYDPFAIYAHGTIVGFYSFCYRPHDMTVCYLGGFLIDRAHQRGGYGQAALATFLNWLQTQHPVCQAIGLTVHPDNVVATHLYQQVGFRKTGGVIDGEDTMELRLS